MIRSLLNMLFNTIETRSVERKTSSECLPISGIKWSLLPKGRLSLAGSHEMKGVHKKCVLYLCSITGNYRVQNVVIRQHFIRGVWKVMRLLAQFCIWGFCITSFPKHHPSQCILPCRAPPTSQTCSGPFSDTVCRVVVVPCITSLLEPNFCPHSSC